VWKEVKNLNCYIQFQPLLIGLISVLKCMNKRSKDRNGEGGSDGLLEPPLQRSRPSKKQAEVDAFDRNVVTCDSLTCCVWDFVWMYDARLPLGLAMAQAVTKLRSPVAQVQSLDSPCGICQLSFHQCSILPSVSWGWCSRPICGHITKGLSLQLKNKGNSSTFL
jgi:hypothetical protein